MIIAIGGQESKLRTRLSPDGGVIVDAYVGDLPFLRPYKDSDRQSIDPLRAGSFPLVPFGNRVEGNRFYFENQEYELQRNTRWDMHYLHGDAWLATWDVVETGDNRVKMQMQHAAVPGQPYEYSASQDFSITQDTLSISLSVTNDSLEAMPFGIGHHLFFPLADDTTLLAQAEYYWTEKEDFLPDRRLRVPEELDFSSPKVIPDRWLNNGFEPWSGVAVIESSQTGLRVAIQADEIFRSYFLFRSDEAFESGFAKEYFCFEPMTHQANAHNLEGGGGLVRLAPGESLSGTVKLRPSSFPPEEDA